MTAPEGSLSIDALSTLVQKVMVTGGLSVGEAMLRVDLALGLSLKTDATTANLITDTFNGVTDAPQALIANAVVLNTLILAKAAGATGDLFGKLAGQIAAADYGVVDPTATSTLQALGLDGVSASTVSALAQAQATLLANKLEAGGTSGQALQHLAETVAGVDRVEQGAAAPDVGAAQGLPGPVILKYTGQNLAAQVDAASAARYATPFDVAYTDVTSGTIAYGNGTAYDGGFGGATKLFVLPGADDLAIGATGASIYLRTGSGTDALQATGGNNVLEGGTGSSFLVGGTGADGGADTFLVDASSGTTWSTIVNFHAGDVAWLFGFHARAEHEAYTASDGVAGFQGLTLHSELNGAGTGVDVSLTFAGVDPATQAAHFSVSTGTTADARDFLRMTYNP